MKQRGASAMELMKSAPNGQINFRTCIYAAIEKNEVNSYVLTCRDRQGLLSTEWYIKNRHIKKLDRNSLERSTRHCLLNYSIEAQVQELGLAGDLVCIVYSCVLFVYCAHCKQ